MLSIQMEGARSTYSHWDHPYGRDIAKAALLDESAPAWVLFYDMEEQSFKKIDITGLPEWVYSSGTRIIRTISVYGG